MNITWKRIHILLMDKCLYTYINNYIIIFLINQIKRIINLTYAIIMQYKSNY